MSAKLPYLSSPGTLKNALEKIKAAATPPKFNHDFVQSKLKIKGGAGRAIVPYLKKIGFVASDGSPTSLYQRYRNDSTSGSAVAEALKTGYKSLYEVNEYTHELSDKELKGLVLQVTGLEDGNRVVALICGTLKKLKEFADFDPSQVQVESQETKSSTDSESPKNTQELGFNIAYTINLNLPSTSNIEVFNAIFKSLRENLLRED